MLGFRALDPIKSVIKYYLCTPAIWNEVQIMRDRLIGFTFILTTIFFLSTSISKAQQDITNSKKVKFSIYPAISYKPETKFALGIVSFIVFDQSEEEHGKYHRPSSISPQFLYTQNKQMILSVDMEMYMKNGYALITKPKVYNYPDFYYGIGNDNDPDSSETYTNKYQQVDGRFSKFINSKWSAGIRFDIQHNYIHDFDEGGHLINGNVAGTDGGMNVGFGPTMQYDTRDNIFYPTNGMFATAEVTFYLRSFGGDNSYTLYSMDFRRYFSIKNEKNVLALQMAANFTSGSSIPFYNLQKIGGDNRLRGIANANLYIDRQAFWAQVEYRRKLFWRFGGTAFVGLGEVAPTMDQFSIDGLKYVLGIGGRFQALKDEKLNLRVDAGLGPDGQYAFYFSIKEAF